MSKESLNLVLTEELDGSGTETMYIPSLFYPYGMKLITASKAYYLQFLELGFLKGYAILCAVLGLNAREHCKAYKVK